MDFQDRNSRQTAQVNTDSLFTESRTRKGLEACRGHCNERPRLPEGPESFLRTRGTEQPREGSRCGATSCRFARGHSLGGISLRTSRRIQQDRERTLLIQVTIAPPPASTGARAGCSPEPAAAAGRPVRATLAWPFPPGEKGYFGPVPSTWVNLANITQQRCSIHR